MHEPSSVSGLANRRSNRQPRAARLCLLATFAFGAISGCASSNVTTISSAPVYAGQTRTFVANPQDVIAAARQAFRKEGIPIHRDETYDGTNWWLIGESTATIWGEMVRVIIVPSSPVSVMIHSEKRYSADLSARGTEHYANTLFRDISETLNPNSNAQPATDPSPQPEVAPAASAPAPAAASSEALSGAPQLGSYALIVAIEGYRDLPAATGAGMDPQHYREMASRTFGIPPAQIREAIDARATKADIERQLEWLKENVPAGSRVYFFFSGHGSPEPSTGTPYLVPYDADSKNMRKSALPLTGVLASLQQTKAKEVVAFVDSCFSGQGSRSLLPPGTRPLVAVKDTSAPAKVVLFSASGGNEISGPAPGNQGGLFSHFVFQGLGQGSADINGDGQITASELQQWLPPRVSRVARQDGREQNPIVKTGSGQASLNKIIMLWGLGPR